LQVPACTGPLVVTIGHVTVVQFGALPTLAEQVPEATAALELFDVLHEIPVHELVLLAGVVVQVATGTSDVLFGVQVVVTQLGPIAGPDATHVPAWTATLTALFVVQVVAVQLLPALATGSGVQVCTATAPLGVTGHVVEIQFGATPGLATHDPLGTFNVLFAVQVVVV
jgi:hypothetical protein